MFLSLCESCLMKSKVQQKGLVVKPILRKQFNAGAQVDLIDMQESKAEKLLNIFLDFGARGILQSDNGREFRNSIVTELKILWPEHRIVRPWKTTPQSIARLCREGQPRHREYILAT